MKNLTDQSSGMHECLPPVVEREVRDIQNFSLFPSSLDKAAATPPLERDKSFLEAELLVEGSFPRQIDCENWILLDAAQAFLP